MGPGPLVLCLIAVWAGRITSLAESLHQLAEVDLSVKFPRTIAVLLRVFFARSDKFNHLPLHEAIVLKAPER